VVRNPQEAGRGFIEFLGIKTVPSPFLVVCHLLECARTGQPVNPQVYRFLNDNATDPAVEMLRGRQCLLLSNSRYVRPDEVFWDHHDFGKYRFQLDNTWRVFAALLTRLDVREAPQPDDAVKVLLEV